MSLFFRYGSYQHPPGEVVLSSINWSTQFSGRGEPMLSKAVWQIQGILQGDNVDDLTFRLQALEQAYSRQAQNAGLFNGNNVTAHYLPTGTAIGGVRSTGVSYPKGDAIEYVTHRSYSVTLEADYPVNGTSLLEFNETLTFQGTCGPRRVFLLNLNGEPEEQITVQKTTQKVTQSGSAVGFYSYPAPPQPLWPGNEIEEARTINPGSPRNVNGRRVDWPISWSYSFESKTPLNGTPHT